MSHLMRDSTFSGMASIVAPDMQGVVSSGMNFILSGFTAWFICFSVVPWFWL